MYYCRYIRKKCSVITKVVVICEENSKLMLSVNHEYSLDDSSVMNCSFEYVCRKNAQCQSYHVFKDTQTMAFLVLLNCMILQWNKLRLLLKHNVFVMIQVFFYEENAECNLKGVGVLDYKEQF